MNNFLEFVKLNKIKIEKICAILLFFLTIFIFFKFIFVLVAPFIIGYCISFFLEPVVRFLMNKFKLNRATSAIISILLMIFIIGGSVFLIISQAFSQLRILITNDPLKYLGIIEQSLNSLLAFVPDFFFYIPEENKVMINQVLNDIWSAVLSFSSEQLKVFGLAFVKFVPKFFVYIFVGIISSFFFIKDKMLINNLFRNNTPDIIKLHFVNIKTGLSEAFLGYLKSQSIIMCFTATISLAGLSILQNKYAILLALCIAVVDVLPLFGSGFILWPLSLVSFLTGDIKTGVGALIIYGTIQITRQIIEPKILGSQIGLHPLVTFMSMYSGLYIFGVLGIVLGPMSVIIIKTIWNSDFRG